MAFYTSDRLENGVLLGNRGGETYEIKDDRKVLAFFAENSKSMTAGELVKAFASNIDFWGEDLTNYDSFVSMAAADLEDIRANGMTAAVEALVKD